MKDFFKLLSIFIILLFFSLFFLQYNEITGNVTFRQVFSSNTNAVKINNNEIVENLILEQAIKSGACKYGEGGLCFDGKKLSQHNSYIIIQSDGDLRKIDLIKNYYNQEPFARIQGKKGVFIISAPKTKLNSLFGKEIELWEKLKGIKNVNTYSGEVAIPKGEKEECINNKQNKYTQMAKAKSEIDDGRNRVSILLNSKYNNVAQGSTGKQTNNKAFTDYRGKCEGSLCFELITEYDNNGNVKSQSIRYFISDSSGSSTSSSGENVVIGDSTVKRNHDGSYSVDLKDENGNKLDEEKCDQCIVEPGNSGVYDMASDKNRKMMNENGDCIAGCNGGNYVLSMDENGNFNGCTGDCNLNNPIKKESLCMEDECVDSTTVKKIISYGKVSINNPLLLILLKRDIKKETLEKIGMLIIPTEKGSGLIVMPGLKPVIDPKDDSASGYSNIQDPCSKIPLGNIINIGLKNILIDLIKDVDPVYRNL